MSMDEKERLRISTIDLENVSGELKKDAWTIKHCIFSLITKKNERFFTNLRTDFPDWSDYTRKFKKKQTDVKFYYPGLVGCYYPNNTKDITIILTETFRRRWVQDELPENKNLPEKNSLDLSSCLSARFKSKNGDKRRNCKIETTTNAKELKTSWRLSLLFNFHKQPFRQTNESQRFLKEDKEWISNSKRQDEVDELKQK